MLQTANLRTATRRSPPLARKFRTARRPRLQFQQPVPGIPEWIARADERAFGSLRLDFSAPWIDAALRRFGPALIFDLQTEDRDLVIETLRAFLAFVKRRPGCALLMASYPIDDALQASVLERSGFLATGMLARGDGRTWMQMINIL